MPELKSVIKLHSIHVTSLKNPHDDLPGDMKMFAQLIIEENIFLQALPVASEQDQNSWTLVFGCNIDMGFTDPHFFSAQPMLLLSQWQSCARVKPRENGLLVMLKSGVVKSLDLWNKSGVAFQLQLNKVNPDGPSLNFHVGFSVSELPYQEVSGLHLMGMPENTVASVKGGRIRTLGDAREDSTVQPKQ
ncbi:hypothetical protein K438DRAFT_1771369 [Mycena galopus ATCC 62051]|nr:hypothetical protein K438DRAFT_1771369 [Mycena galopus ATCC 62051]